MPKPCLALLIAAALGVLGACRGSAPVSATPVIIETDRFPHDQHAQIACADCHDAAAVAAGVVQLPGARDHAPCDQGQCHQAAFETAPGPLCRVCHLTVDVTGAGAAQMVPYPRSGGWRVMPARFSHRLHLDASRIERAVGFHVGCSDCHSQRADAEAPSSGGHADCARCHAAEVGLPDAPAMDDCKACHQPDTRVERHRRRMITGDLHFAHANHQKDARGDAIRCTTCHTGTGTAPTRDADPPPAIATCVACHDDRARVPGSMGMRSCRACHGTISENISKLAPRSHLPATERPIDHTLAFRRDHGEDARRDTKRCANCHTQMSGNARAACDECHQVMRPGDHNVMFREMDHGTAASTDAERCATCHVVDYCISCHTQRPRSHLFDWSESHRFRARANPRSCYVCHDPDQAPPTGCIGSGCHQGFSP